MALLKKWKVARTFFQQNETKTSSLAQLGSERGAFPQKVAEKGFRLALLGNSKNARDRFLALLRSTFGANFSFLAAIVWAVETETSQL